ncbi:spore maturation protein [Fervidicella metallireducens AeB]|uniref:Spore maturation protein n=1 Tax=Fervidicella metallireducens AeB TaxID=1403537 RepID=A0A017RY95_9CLOT|nr:nucleoside recognition domain-containing protein [Fervidicella metallireducens]EYE89753.1 spore maturation protein [Fervidicella metallireducens AeB]
MINIIWFFMIVVGIVTLMIKGDIQNMMIIMSESAEKSMELLIALSGIMAVWSGMMRLCEKSGMVDLAAKLLSLPMRILFPGLDKKNKKALGSIIMNLATNMMGLSNAATPFGIKAMNELQSINPQKDRASDYMVTFLIVNATCVQFLPTTVISIRAGLKSSNPSDIIVPTIIATTAALISGLISNLLLRKIYK